MPNKYIHSVVNKHFYFLKLGTVSGTVIELRMVSYRLHSNRTMRLYTKLSNAKSKWQVQSQTVLHRVSAKRGPWRAIASGSGTRAGQWVLCVYQFHLCFLTIKLITVQRKWIKDKLRPQSGKDYCGIDKIYIVAKPLKFLAQLPTCTFSLISFK